MKKLMLAVLVLMSTSTAFAEDSVSLDGADARLMAKVLKLVGIPGDLVVDEDGIQYHLRKTDCSFTRIAADGLPTYQCVSSEDGTAYADELASATLFSAFAEAGLTVQGDASSGKIHIEDANCTVYMGGSTYCELSTQPAQYDEY